MNLLERAPALWRERFRTLGRIAADRNLTLCAVGGCVRDLLLKKPPLDWDVIVEGAAAGLVRDAQGAFGAGLVSHPAFLTYTLTFPDGTSLDVATARQETYPEPAALPVVEPAGLAQDFARRDFSVNAMAVHLTPERWGKIEDPFDGRADLRRGVVRVLHERSFEDDPTRLYRAARYAGRYGWRLEAGTRRLLAAAVAGRYPARLSPARLRAELERQLEERDPRAALSMLWKAGAWTFWSGGWRWAPFFAKALGPRAEGGDWTLVRLMILCRFRTPEEARQDLRALEFPGAVADTVSRALKLLRTLESRSPEFSESPHLPEATKEFLKSALRGSAALKRWEACSPVLNGKDLQDLGYAPGPVYQKILESLRRARWEGGVRNRADEVRHLIDKFPRKQ